MATVNNHVVFFSGHKVSPPTNPISYSTTFSISPPTKLFSQSRKNHRVYPVMKSIAEDKEVVADEQNGSERESGVVGEGSEGIDKFASKAINASIVLGFGTLAVTRLLTIDHEYWHAVCLPVNESLNGSDLRYLMVQTVCFTSRCLNGSDICL
ncbi:hypothetical protein HanOQP8_Chr10g0363371 [Helianthus annuus]|nr:hypothetical protein HanOQP8_Chr10g0363371 [Helianthus annuus]